MEASAMLTNAAIGFVALTVWSDLKANGRLTTRPRTWLLVAVVFAGVSIVVGLLS